MNKRYLGVAISTFIVCFFLLLFGPIDFFSHGYFEEQIDVSQIPTDAMKGEQSLDSCKITIKPQKKHFAGIELYLINHNPEEGDVCYLVISNSKGKEVGRSKIELDKITESSWYRVFTESKLKKGKEYTISFDAFESDNIPSVVLVDDSYLQKEYVSGNALVSFAYGSSTFTFHEKIIISLIIISVYLFMISILINIKKVSAVCRYVACFLLLTAPLTWVYMFNNIDEDNSSFDSFQVDSECLVTGVIYAQRDGIWFTEQTKQKYGLGYYYDLIGLLRRYDREYLTDENWDEGYNINEPMIAVKTSPITAQIVQVGNILRFANGEEKTIIDSVDDGTYILITLNADGPLSKLVYGSLDGLIFYDKNHNVLQKSLLEPYESQYGLQGKIFRHMARHMNITDCIENLHLICSLLAAAVFALIVIMLAKNYNYLMAAVFWFTFFLSPWVINFARNLYWVEFTWFTPMLVGLVCLYKLKSKGWRIGCYIAAFITVAIKCLCGYEYISVIMMGLISFLLVEFFNAIVKKESELSNLLFRTIFIIGISALLGFIIAILIHAPIKGDGSIIAGIKNIIKEDVLRRTGGTNLNDFDSEYWPSMNASIWETYSRYFHFGTSIITGLKGNLFIPLTVIPIGIIGYDYYSKKSVNTRELFLYIVSFFTSISWFVLAKNHSYVHIHMNYVLWYFGFVQVCLYIIINRIVNKKTNLGE